MPVSSSLLGTDRHNTATSLTERLRYKGAVTAGSLMKTWCYVLKIPHCLGFYYALHFPEGEGCASNATFSLDEQKKKKSMETN